MAKRRADLDLGVTRMLALSGTHDDVVFTVTRGVTRPVWEPSAATLALYETARRLARELGFDITYGSAAAAPAPISQARWESQHSVASVCAAPTAIRSMNISRSTAWSSAAG